MFIELTDHLRCPDLHPESFLVLIPEAMNRREVRRGTLGCPVCQREYRIEDGVVWLGGAERPGGGGAAPGTAPGAASVDAAALAAFLGVEGPGGFVGLIGEAGATAWGLSTLLPGVHLVLVNPPPDLAPSPDSSRVMSPALPIKRGSMRGMVVGRDYAATPAWVEAAIGAVLPGLRIAGEGPPPDTRGFELMGSAEGWWVGRRLGD
jgi:uncharacterized protein YbaR (Trm112 family)